MTLTKDQLQILQHSLGVDQYGLGERYRNHFVTDDDSKDGQNCNELVALGLMSREPPQGDISGGMPIFRVTTTGISVMMIESPKPPKISASQRRYQSYLAEEPGIPFGQWLKKKTRTPLWP